MRAWDVKQTSPGRPGQVPAGNQRPYYAPGGGRRDLVPQRPHEAARPTEKVGAAMKLAIEVSVPRRCFLAAVLAAAGLLSMPAQEIGQQPKPVVPGALPGQPPSDAVVLFDGKGVEGVGLPRWARGAMAGGGRSSGVEERNRQYLQQAEVRRARRSTWNSPRPTCRTRTARRAGTAACICRAGTRSRFWIPSTIPPMRTAPPGRSTASTRRWLTCRARRRNGRPTTLFFTLRCALPMESPRLRGRSRCCTTACWFRITWRSGAAPPAATRRMSAKTGPLMLQDHYHPDVKETFMRFRNIWVRPLP